VTDGTACPDDGLSCTSDVCQGGACTHPLQANACLIAGACHPAGAPEPGVDCASCQPALSTSSWSPAPNGAACTSDGIACHQAVCASGACTHPIAAGSCYINGNCIAAGAQSPTNACQTCQPAVSTTSWSNVVDGTLCNGGGPSCTTASCLAGTCTQTVLPNACLIAGTCVAGGTQDPLDDCRACQPAQSTSTYTTKADGASCTSDNLSCTADICTAGACTHPQQAGTCLIGGACFKPGDLDPSDACQECTPGASAQGWSPVPGCVADAGTDASTDAGMGDAGTDASADAGTGDAGTDASADAGAGDAGTDASADAGAGDAGTDAGAGDAGTDASADAGAGDAGTDASADAGTGDAGEDASADAGTGGAGGGASAAGGGASADAGTSQGGQKGGCGCRVAGSSEPGSGMLVVALALALAGARRRLRSRG
jgi:MYXO-CTERM domain-containing protein